MSNELKPIHSKMTLRYTCETTYAKVFTGSKKVKDRYEADKKVVAMIVINKQSGYTKYSNFKLYDSGNKQINDF